MCQQTCCCCCRTRASTLTSAPCTNHISTSQPPGMGFQTPSLVLYHPCPCLCELWAAPVFLCGCDCHRSHDPGEGSHAPQQRAHGNQPGLSACIMLFRYRFCAQVCVAAQRGRVCCAASATTLSSTCFYLCTCVAGPGPARGWGPRRRPFSV